MRCRAFESFQPSKAQSGCEPTVLERLTVGCGERRQWRGDDSLLRPEASAVCTLVSLYGDGEQGSDGLREGWLGDDRARISVRRKKRVRDASK